MAKLLETDRLLLETLEQKHFKELCSLLANEKVHQYFPKTLNKEEAQEFYNKVKKGYSEDGYSFWAVIRKEDTQFIGICGLLKQIINSQEEVEVGYRINDSYWGRGYATEAAQGCVTYAKDVLKKRRVISLILKENLQSVRVAEKNSMTLVGETLFYEKMHRVYRIQFPPKQYTKEQEEIKAIVNDWSEKLVSLPEGVISQRRNKQSRTIKHLLGHLIDSAVNNHHRLVRLQYTNQLEFPDYWQDNDRWIAIQNYLAEDWKQLVGFWQHYNWHIIHLIKNIDHTKKENCWTDYQGNVETLDAIVKGYVWHLNLHINDIKELIEENGV